MVWFDGEKGSAERENGIERTHTQHPTHSEPLNLLETLERDFGDFLEEGAERSFEERFGDAADLGVDFDHRHESFVNVRADLCESRWVGSSCC